MDEDRSALTQPEIIRGSFEATATTVPRDIGSVYGRGELVNIDIEDLVGNKTAIQQLINNHNQQAKKCADAERRLSDREGEIEFLKTSPFIALVMLPVGGVGAVIGGIGVNLVTSEHPPSYADALMYIGAGLILLGGLANVLYPFARRVFNGKPR